MNPLKKIVSIIIPARNEQATIAHVLEKIHSCTTEIKGHDFEVIVVLDHCVDQTEAIACRSTAMVIKNEEKPGKGNAIRTGLRHCRGDIIIMMDADGSHMPEDISGLIDAIYQGASLVIGSRAKGGSDEYEVVRLFGNVFFTFLANVLFGFLLTDALNGYKAFTKEFISKHKLSSRGFEIEIELLYIAAGNKNMISEVGSHELSRMGDKMKSNTLKDGFRFLSAILKWGIQFRLKRIFQRSPG